MKWVLWIGGALAALLVLTVGVLLALGARKDANRLYYAVELPASPAEVWPWLYEPGRLKQWVSWLSEVHPESPAPEAGKKTRWIMLDANNGNRPMEIVAVTREVEPARRLLVRSTSAEAFEGDASYVLTDLGNGRTRLETEARYQFHRWFYQLLMPVIVPQAQKKLEMDCAQLQRLLAGSRSEYTRK
ncbi:MAG TPA: hypothetical protein DEH78_21275 [Solibacterales bacterium]|nr:hypothetical protein [Bryobacterales bacterium]